MPVARVPAERPFEAGPRQAVLNHEIFGDVIAVVIKREVVKRRRQINRQRAQQQLVSKAAYTILTLYNQMMPPTTNYEFPDPDCDLDYVPNVARKAHIEVALSNSFGFGGTNGTLVIRRWTEK